MRGRGSAPPAREECERQQAQNKESAVAAAARFRFLSGVGVGQKRTPVRHAAQRDARRSQRDPRVRGISLQLAVQRLDGRRV